MNKLLVLLILLLINTATFGQYSGKITKVSDGETIWVKLVSGETDSVKLWGIDAPELDQQYGKAAKEHLAKQIHREVMLEYKSRDRNKFMQAIVTYTLKNGEEVNLNYALVEDGYAWKNKYTDDKRLEKLQDKAKKNKVGLWRKANPIPPWEWRKANK